MMRTRWISLHGKQWRSALGRLAPVAAVLCLVLAAAYALPGAPPIVLIFPAAGVVLVVAWLRRRWTDNIETRIAKLVGRQRMKRMRTYTKDFPGFRLVDVCRATDRLCRQNSDPVVIESHHEHEDLNSLLHAKAGRLGSRRVQGASRLAWAVGPGEEDYFPIDCFWVTQHADGGSAQWVVFRIRYIPYSDRVVLETASENLASGRACVDEIVAASARDSIYRHQTLEVSFEPGVKDEYGEVENAERFNVSFKATELVEDADIILDPQVQRTLQRNVLDLHLHRDRLKAHGVPVRRGVLLYGPPGTGKTFACRYLCGRLPQATKLIAAGNALLRVKSVFNLARLLQPSVIVLEDVDLVFSAREINLYSSVLGELLDQMDGLRPYEDVSVILTTNAIDRLEAAIRDRPGRLSQLVHFGAPTDELRRRYLVRYLQPHSIEALDFDDLVRVSHGATQAFLKEWVHRAVQVALERVCEDAGPRLTNGDFHVAFEEMRRFSQGTSGRIIGFHD